MDNVPGSCLISVDVALYLYNPIISSDYKLVAGITDRMEQFIFVNELVIWNLKEKIRVYSIYEAVAK